MRFIIYHIDILNVLFIPFQVS